MRRIVVIVIALIVGGAAAFDVPADATIVLTSADGLVVGVGTLERGALLTLDVLAGFRGSARLLIISDDGTITVLEVEIAGDRIALGDADWLALLSAAGFDDYVITGLDVPTTHAPLLRTGIDVRPQPAAERPGTPAAPVDTPRTTVPAPEAPPTPGGLIVGPDLDADESGRRDSAPRGQ